MKLKCKLSDQLFRKILNETTLKITSRVTHWSYCTEITDCFLKTVLKIFVS
jgi:hypothetical protein